MSEKLNNLLNDAIARELQVSIQYMWQHVMAKGFKGLAVKGEFKSFAVAEMKHAEAISERLMLLGGSPTVKPTTIEVSKDVDEMLKNNVKAEEGAIELYKEIIKVAGKEGDPITEALFVDIIAEETDHLHVFSNLLK